MLRRPPTRTGFLDHEPSELTNYSNLHFTFYDKVFSLTFVLFFRKLRKSDPHLYGCTPLAGFEPTHTKLTAWRSATELQRHIYVLIMSSMFQAIITRPNDDILQNGA